MEGIPPIRKEDVEDVVWALQTADSHWKRNERSDALLWLRRAAEAAGDANDDARALMLAREAQLLSSLMSADAADEQIGEADLVNEADIVAAPLSDLPVSELPVSDLPLSLEETVPRGVEVVSDPFGAQFEAPTRSSGAVIAAEADAEYVDDYAVDDDAQSITKVRKQVKSSDSFDKSPDVSTSDEEEISSTTLKAVEEAELIDEDDLVGLADRVSKAPSIPPIVGDDDLEASLPLQIEVNEGPTRRFALLEDTPEAAATALRISDRPTSPPPSLVANELLAQSASPSILGKKPPLPAGASGKPAPPKLPVPPPVPGKKPPLPKAAAKGGAPPLASKQPDPRQTPSANLAPQIDLNGIAAFHELSDDARLVLANSAEVKDLACNDEVGGFALALLMGGEADVAATIIDASALRLSEGSVLCARGTMPENVPMRLICASDDAKIATWNDEAMVEAFRSVPWALDKLKEEGDQHQALVGITLGPLGDRLDADLRDGVLGKLKLRRIRPGEVIVEKGKPLPGVIVVGVGEIALSDGSTVEPGSFMFPMEIMMSGPAPATAKGGKAGALVMFGDRMVAQELLVTCPPLLEILSS